MNYSLICDHRYYYGVYRYMTIKIMLKEIQLQLSTGYIKHDMTISSNTVQYVNIDITIVWIDHIDYIIWFVIWHYVDMI